jgi:hypothetical protein
MSEHVSCPRCGCACRVGPHHSAHCVQCFTSFRTDAQDGPRLPYACPRCEQLSDVQGLCPRCVALDREPQGESVRLFQPAPTQLPGQLAL